MTVAHFHNPRALARAALYAAPLRAVLDEEGFCAAHREIASWPDYGPTPLLALDRTAASLGIAKPFYKDEALPFPLKTSKPPPAPPAASGRATRSLRRRPPPGCPAPR